MLKALIVSTVLARYLHVLHVNAPAFEKVKRVRVTCLSLSDPRPASLTLQRHGTELADNVKLQILSQPGRGLGLDFETCQEPPDELSPLAALRSRVDSEIVQAAQEAVEGHLGLKVKVSVQWDSVEALSKDARRFVTESLAGEQGAGPLAGLVDVVEQCGLLLDSIKALLSPENAKAVTKNMEALSEIIIKVTTQLPKRSSGLPRIENISTWACCLGKDGEDFSLQVNAHLLTLYSFLWTCLNACIMLTSEHPCRFLRDCSITTVTTELELGDNFLPKVFLGKKIHVDFDSFRELCSGSKISDMALRRVIMATVLSRYPDILDLEGEAWEKVTLLKVQCLPHSSHEEARIMATDSTCLKDIVKLRMPEQATQPEVTCGQDVPDSLTSVEDARRGVDLLASELSEKTTAFLGKEVTVRVDWSSVDAVQDSRLRRLAIHTLMGEGGLPPMAGLSDVLERCRALRDNIEDFQGRDFADAVLQVLHPVKEVVVRFSEKLPDLRPKSLSSVDSTDTWFFSPERRRPFSFIYCSQHLFFFSALKGCHALTLSLQEANSVLRPSTFKINWSSFGAVCKVSDFGKIGREGLAVKASRMAHDLERFDMAPYENIKWDLENSASKPSVRAEYIRGNGAVWNMSIVVNARLNNGTWVVGFPDCLGSLAETKLASSDEEEKTSLTRKSLQKVAGGLSKTLGIKLEISLRTDRFQEIQRWLVSSTSYDSDMEWFSEGKLSAVDKWYNHDEEISARWKGSTPELLEGVVLEAVAKALERCPCKLIGSVKKRHGESKSGEVTPGLWFSLTQESLHNGLSCDRILMLLKEDLSEQKLDSRRRYTRKNYSEVHQALDGTCFVETTKKEAQSRLPSGIIGAWYHTSMSKAKEEKERFKKDPRSFPQLVTICNKVFYVENPKRTLQVLSRIPKRIVLCEDSNSQKETGTFHFVRNDPMPVTSLSAYLLSETSALPEVDLSIFQAWETGVQMGMSFVFDPPTTTRGQQRVMAEAVGMTLKTYLARREKPNEKAWSYLLGLKHKNRNFLKDLGTFFVGTGQLSSLPFSPHDTVTGDSFGEPVDIYLSSKHDIYVSFRQEYLLKFEEPKSAAESRKTDTSTRFKQEHLLWDGARVTFVESFSKAMNICQCRQEEDELSAQLSRTLGGKSIRVDARLAHLVSDKCQENFARESAIASRALVSALHNKEILDVKSVEFTLGKTTAKMKSAACVQLQDGALKVSLTDGGKRWTREELGNALKRLTRAGSEAAADDPTPVARVPFPDLKISGGRYFTMQKIQGAESGRKPNQIAVIEKKGTFLLCVAHERECRVSLKLVNPCVPPELYTESAPIRKGQDRKRLVMATPVHVQFYAHIHGGFYDMTKVKIIQLPTESELDNYLHLTGVTAYACRVTRLHKKAGLSARCLVCGHPLALLTPQAWAPSGTKLELVRRKKERKS